MNESELQIQICEDYGKKGWLWNLIHSACNQRETSVVITISREDHECCLPWQHGNRSYVQILWRGIGRSRFNRAPPLLAYFKALPSTSSYVSQCHVLSSSWYWRYTWCAYLLPDSPNYMESSRIQKTLFAIFITVASELRAEHLIVGAH